MLSIEIEINLLTGFCFCDCLISLIPIVILLIKKSQNKKVISHPLMHRHMNLRVYNLFSNCSDPHFSGEGGTIYSTGFFFVQSILADRYIHRTEL